MIDAQPGILERDPVVFHNTLDTNATGPLLLAQACVRVMMANGYGRIVNMASTLGSLAEISSPDGPHAAALPPACRPSKTLLNGITALLAMELRGTNILVNRKAMAGDTARRSNNSSLIVWRETPIFLQVQLSLD